jgi:hypothetical protein
VTDRAPWYINVVTDRASWYINVVTDRASWYIRVVTDRASWYISVVTDLHRMTATNMKNINSGFEPSGSISVTSSVFITGFTKPVSIQAYI